jgi:ATP-dependent Lon protease
VDEDLTKEQRDGVNIHFVKTLDDVLEIALPKTRADENRDAEVREEVLSNA